jgi:putative membrane protein
MIMGPLVVVSIVFLKGWGLLSLIILVLVTLWGGLKYKDAGWSLQEQQLSLRYRSMVRTTVFIKKNKIQSLELKESYFQRQKDLGTLEAFVKSGFGGAGGRVIDMDRMDVEKIYTWFSRESEKGD